MQAIRKKVKRTGKYITVELPDSFQAEEIEVILLPAEVIQQTDTIDEMELWLQKALQFYDQFKYDIKNLDWNRDELYERA